jgi:hypothetical protein
MEAPSVLEVAELEALLDLLAADEYTVLARQIADGHRPRVAASDRHQGLHQLSAPYARPVALPGRQRPFYGLHEEALRAGHDPVSRRGRHR